MINEQVSLWIRQNQQVYATGALRKWLTADRSRDIGRTILDVVVKYAQIIERTLKEGRPAVLQNLVGFQIVKTQTSHNKYELTPKYWIEGAIRRKILVSLQYKIDQAALKTQISIEQLYKEVGSLLFIDWEIVRELLAVYSRAIGDIVAAGKKIKLNLEFCVLFLQRNKASCQFKKSFVRQLNSPAKTSKQTYGNLWLSKAVNIDKQNERWRTCWQQIKEGNLFNHPSLRQIKEHLGKGYQLQLRYKAKFQ